MSRILEPVVQSVVASRVTFLAPLLATTLGLLLASFGCGPAEPADSRPTHTTAGPLEREAVLVIGDLDPDTPGRRIRRLLPLVDFLRQSLTSFGIARVDVRIARDIDEMADFLENGEVDVFLDSPYPTLVVRRRTGSKIALLRWARGAPQYWTLVVRAGHENVSVLSDLLGRVLVLQDPYSTSGYLLPLALLRQQGLRVREVSSLHEQVPADEIGYFFSRDEENSFELVLSGLATATAVSNQDFDELPDQLRDQLTIVARTESVPRQLVSFRAGLDPALAQRIVTVLLGITDEDRREMAAQDPELGWTWRFEELNSLHFATLDALDKTIEMVAP